MKLFVAIIIVAMAIQVSLAGSSQGSAHDIRDMATLGKRLIPLTESVIRVTIPKIPKTNANKKYRRQLRSYLASVNEYNTKRGGCYAKTFELIEKFTKLYDSYAGDDAAPEAKNVLSLMAQHGGADEMARVLAEYKVLYENSNFPVAWQNMSASDIELMTPLLQEVC